VSATDTAIFKATTAAKAAAAKLGREIKAIDVSDQLAIADIFVVVSGDSERQVGAIFDSVEEALLAQGFKALRREGKAGGRWVLLDYGDVVIHIMHTEEREFYALERIWKDCPFIDMGVNEIAAIDPVASEVTYLDE
jgi:ribosome-associated protein